MFKIALVRYLRDTFKPITTTEDGGFSQQPAVVNSFEIYLFLKNLRTTVKFSLFNMGPKSKKNRNYEESTLATLHRFRSVGYGKLDNCKSQHSDELTQQCPYPNIYQKRADGSTLIMFSFDRRTEIQRWNQEL